MEIFFSLYRRLFVDKYGIIDSSESIPAGLLKRLQIRALYGSFAWRGALTQKRSLCQILLKSYGMVIPSP
jgi:hypothetical protein